MYNFASKEELFQFVRKNFLFTPEVIEYLGITKQGVNDLVKRGKILPIKEFSNGKLFFKPSCNYKALPKKDRAL